MLISSSESLSQQVPETGASGLIDSRSSELDHVGRAVRYAREARADVGARPGLLDRLALKRAGGEPRDPYGRRHGRLFRLGAERFLNDLERARRGTSPFTFDREWALRACRFVEELPHVEGAWDSATIRLHTAHAFLIVNLFGFREGERRRFSSALLATARKNAKSTIAAGILIACQCLEREPGAQIITAATTGSQARIVFNIAKQMVMMTPDLRNEFGLIAFANAVSRAESSSSIKPINAKASTQDGLNPSHTCLDEIHAHKDHGLLNVLRSAAGARENPLWFYATTEGYEGPGPWAEIRDFAYSVLRRLFAAEHFLAAIFAVDDEDDDFEESAWVKANPLMDVNPVLERQIRIAALEARQMPGQLAEFRIKRLNRRSSTALGWVDLPRWRACSGQVDLAWLATQKCYGGLDLASTTDMSAFRLFWLLDGHAYTWGVRWVPETAVRMRTERGTVPYEAWVGAGLIRQTPGDVTDYAVIERDMDEIRAEFPLLQEICFDPWNATDLVNRLQDKDYPMIAFRQGHQSYHPAMTGLERLYRARQLSHGGDAVLTWCAANVVPRYDANMNIAPDRKRSAEKIDDFCALLMAASRPLTLKDEGGIDGWLTNPV